jgi:hypothetical protein
MEKQELLQQFTTQFEQYAKVRGFIEKAKSQSSKFRPEVIEKVCLTHEIKSMELAETVLPLVEEIQAQITDLQTIILEVGSAKGGSDEALEEMELRLAIGELSDKDFEKESKELKADLEQADGKIASAQTDLDAFSEALVQWVVMADEAGHMTGVSAISEPEVAVEEVEDVVSVELDSNPFGDEEGEPMDLASGFGEGEVAVSEAQVEIEVGDENVAAEAEEENVAVQELDPHEDSAVPGENDIDFLDGEEAIDENPIVVSKDGPSVSPPKEVPDGETASVGDSAGRRALLLYQEGTAEEQIYPFTNDEICIGRGRDNEIQIKNDSKVSRKHCILFRENDAFFIKDNKSSNGSLVNGELITERRLFGGEEIIIGETFFRFRIMD